MVKVGFVCGSRNKTPFSEFIPLSIFLHTQSISSFFLLDSNRLESIENDLHLNGIPFYIEKDSIRPINSGYDKPRKPEKADYFSDLYNRRKLKSPFPKIINRVAGLLIQIFKTPIVLYKDKDTVNFVFANENPDLIIVYGDRTLGKTQFAIKWMKKNKKPVIDLQVSAVNLIFLYKSYRTNFNYSARNPINYLIGLFHKNLSRNVNGNIVFFYPWYMSIWLWAFGVLPKDPWVCGNNGSDKYLMISKNDFSEYLKTGGNAGKVEIVGQLSLDFLYRSWKKKNNIKETIFKKYELNEYLFDHRIVLLALPQLYEHKIYNKEKALQEIDFLCSSIASASNVIVFVSLHPKMSVNNYLFIQEKYPFFKIIEERLSEILSIADVYLTAFESTVAWAIMCHVKPVFLDFYDLGYDLTKFKSCSILNNRQNLVKDLRGIFDQDRPNEQFFKKDVKQLAKFDGQAGKRIINIINQLVGRNAA